MNKTQYVKIIKKGEYEKGIILPINSEFGDYYHYYDRNKCKHYSIKKSDCEPVEIQELAKDSDGEYLHFYDEVDPIYSETNSEYRFLGAGGEGYWCEDHNNQVCLIKEVRKVKSEPIDPIEEVYKRYEGEKIDSGFEIQRLAHECWEAIKQHMENKKGE